MRCLLVARNIYIDSIKIIEYGFNGQTIMGWQSSLFQLFDEFSLRPRLAATRARSAPHQDAL
jgi:hypothetical protein